MKFKTKKDIKPWDRSIDEILPHNPKYTKIIILSYIFIAFFIFENANFLGMQDDYLYLITFCVYGITSFSLLYVYADGNPKRMLKGFIDLILIFGTIFIIGNVILAVVMGFGFSSPLEWFKSPVNIVKFVLRFIISMFVGLSLFLGPFNLAYMSHRPKPEKHGFIMVIMFSISIFMWILYY